MKRLYLILLLFSLINVFIFIIFNLYSFLPIELLLIFSLFYRRIIPILFLFLLSFFYYRVVKIIFSKRFDKKIEGPNSYNISSTITNNGSNKKKPLIIFTAHYDSISFNISVYNLIFLTFLGSILHGIASTVNHPVISLILYISNLVIFSILSKIKINEKSSGSLDNASGVSLLIELTKLFKQMPLNNFDIKFLWTGAEELGLWGAGYYCYENFDELMEKYDLNKSFVINFDIIGSYIGIMIEKKDRMEKNVLSEILFKTSKKKNILIVKHSCFTISGNISLKYDLYAGSSSLKILLIFSFSFSFQSSV